MTSTPPPITHPVSPATHVPAGGSLDDAADGPIDAGPAALIRSEERLHAGTAWTSAGSIRVEKYLVTETREVTVEVTVEKVRLIRTGPDGERTVVENPPATAPTARTAGAARPAADETSRWLVLHEERVVISKEQVPVERIRLDTYLVTEQQQVTEQVRAERVELLTGAGAGAGADPAPRAPDLDTSASASAGASDSGA